MIKVAPQAQIILRHPAYHVAPAEYGRIAVMSSSGVGTFLGPDLTVLSAFSIPQRPSHAALSPDGFLLAITASDGITFYSTATFEKNHYLNDAYQWCLFGSDSVSWASSRFTTLTAVLEAWDLSKETRIAKAKIPDPFGDSTFLLFPHPLPNSVVVWAAAGQDGQMLFWASLESETIQVTPFVQQDFTLPPAFSPSGKEFLIISEGQLYRYEYPNGPVLAQMDHFSRRRARWRKYLLSRRQACPDDVHGRENVYRRCVQDEGRRRGSHRGRGSAADLPFCKARRWKVSIRTSRSQRDSRSGVRSLDGLAKSRVAIDIDHMALKSLN